MRSGSLGIFSLIKYYNMTEIYKNLDLEDIHYFDPDGNPKIERWVDVPNYIGKYQGSDLGRVKSLKRFVKAKHSPYEIPERILAQTFDCRGYLTIGLSSDGVVEPFRVNVLVGVCFLGHDNKNTDKIIVDHIENKERTNNTIYNLQLLKQRRNTTKDTVNKHGVNCVYNKKDRYHLAIRVDGKKANFGVYDTPEEAKAIYDEVISLIEKGEDVTHLMKKRVPAGSGLKGTFKKGDRFGAQATINGKTRNLGIYNTIEEAHQAYLTAIENKHLYK